MKTIDKFTNGQFDTAKAHDWTAPGGPTLSTQWAAAKPANGSGGAITFPAFSGYTPTPYTPPSTNAPAGNAAFVGWRATTVGFLQSSVAVEAGRQYTLSIWYAGDATQSSLTWVFSATVSMSGVEGKTGDLGAGNNVSFVTFSPSGGWLQKTLTFTPSSSGNATVAVYGIGTNGTLSATGALNISGGTVGAPVLIANASLTTASTGRRAFPLGLEPAGGSGGTFAAGNDPRIPNKNLAGLWHPRVERIDMVVPGNLTVSTTAPGAYLPGNAIIRQIRARLGSKSSNSGDQVVADITLNGATIFASSSDQCTITTAGVADLGANRVASAVVSSVGGVLSLNITSVVGTASDLSVTVWIEVP